MAKFLIRGGRTFIDAPPADDYLRRNIMGGNVGNFMYLYGIIRTLTVDESVTFEPTGYRTKYSQEEIDRFNKSFDGFIIPLADAFRDSFIKEMEGLTELVERLEIPCYIIGVGVSGGAEERLAAKNFGFEKQARAFIKAVLKKSSCIGLRGERTGDFLSYLGFREGEDYRIIGCPSLYTFGASIKIRDVSINPDSPIAYSYQRASQETFDFMKRALEQFQDKIYVPQLLKELKMLLLGMDMDCMKNIPESDSAYLDEASFAENRVRFFLNPFDWIQFAKTREMTVGTKFHGTVAFVLAGTPSILITSDARTREFAKFHKLTSVDESELSNYGDIWELINSVDFHSPETVQRKNFENYIDFLHENGLKTIYDNDMERKTAPLDEMIAGSKAAENSQISPAVLCTKPELAGHIGKLASAPEAEM